MRIAVGVLALALAMVPPARGQLPPSTLAVRDGPDGPWVVWWRSDSAPPRWAEAHDALTRRLRWTESGPGLETAELTLAGTGEAWRVGLVVVRVDPARVRFELVRPAPQRNRMPGRWTIRDAPGDAVLALNAGQFAEGPWGWLVRRGTTDQPPGHGPLAPGIALARDGSVTLLPPEQLTAPPSEAWFGFQSYPAVLLGDGVVPQPLRAPGRGVDLAHRDARLALGWHRDGRLLIVLTRFQGLGGVLEVLPFGLTTPEMSAVLGALGAREAVLMDGGISSQLLGGRGRARRTWPGLRGVALGLVARPAR